MAKFRKILLVSAVCTAALLTSGCGYNTGMDSEPLTPADSVQTEASENLVRNNPAALALASSPEGTAYDEPFTSYTYDFSAYENNYMITVTPDETNTGLVLTVEDNRFDSTDFIVMPPANYMVCLPYSQESASQVCTVIKSADENQTVPDLLKIDFYLSSFDDETLPYTVSRLYSILDGRLVEVEVYDTVADEIIADANDGESILEPMEYIPDSYLYQTETLKFMPEPVVTVNEDGSLEADVITYTLNPDDMTMRRAREECTLDNPLYYGYAAHAIAGNVYQYFIATSLNVSDYENYVEVPVVGADYSNYFFKVDDQRFSTVEELKDYAKRFFSDKIVNEMFLTAPQQYRDIDGELYTILGDGGMNDELGKLTITDWDISENVVTYHTKQEHYDINHKFDGYIDGGDFVIEISNGGESFIVTKYRYPSL